MTKSDKQAVETVNLEEPVWLVFSQSGSRTSVEKFQGKDAAQMAKARASQKAKTTGGHVAVFGPQTNVYSPPPKATAQEVQLSWIVDDEAKATA